MEQKLQNTAYFPSFSNSERFKIGAFFLCLFIDCVLLGIFISVFGDIWPLNLLLEAIQPYASWEFLILLSLLVSGALSCAAAFTRFFAESNQPAFSDKLTRQSHQSSPSHIEANQVDTKQIGNTIEQPYPKKLQAQNPKKQAIDLPLDIFRLLAKHLSYRDLSRLIRTALPLYHDNVIAQIMSSRIQIQIVPKKMATYILLSVDGRGTLYMTGRHEKHCDMFIMAPQSTHHFVKIDQPDDIQKIFDVGTDTLFYLCDKGKRLRTIKKGDLKVNENDYPNDIKFEGIEGEIGEDLLGNPVNGETAFILASIQGTNEKILYASGANKFGELGLGDSKPRDKFETVELPQPAHLIKQMMNAHDITVLVYPNNVYICGKNFLDTFKPLFESQFKNIDSVTIQKILIWIVTTNDQDEKELWCVDTMHYAVSAYVNIQTDNSWHYKDSCTDIDVTVPFEDVKLQFGGKHDYFAQKIREKKTHYLEPGEYQELVSGFAKLLQKIDGFRHRVYNCTADLKEILHYNCKELETVKLINIFCSETEGIYVAAEFQKDSRIEQVFFQFESQQYSTTARYLSTASYEYFPFKNYLDETFPVESIQNFTFFGYTPIDYKDSLVSVTTPEKKQVLCSRDHDPSRNVFKPVFYIPQNYRLLDIITSSESKSTFLALQSHHGRIKLYASGYDSSKVGLGRKSVSSFTEIPDFLGKQSTCSIQ